MNIHRIHEFFMSFLENTKNIKNSDEQCVGDNRPRSRPCSICMIRVFARDLLLVLDLRILRVKS
jgi:hypothetical protein